MLLVIKDDRIKTCDKDNSYRSVQNLFGLVLV